jgi:hypothetical protein
LRPFVCSPRTEIGSMNPVPGSAPNYGSGSWDSQPAGIRITAAMAQQPQECFRVEGMPPGGRGLRTAACSWLTAGHRIRTAAGVGRSSSEERRGYPPAAEGPPSCGECSWAWRQALGSVGIPGGAFYGRPRASACWWTVQRKNGEGYGEKRGAAPGRRRRTAALAAFFFSLWACVAGRSPLEVLPKEDGRRALRCNTLRSTSIRLDPAPGAALQRIG